ncbi:MAG: hypothetical protein Kow0027_01540 [Saprospiraceae bacterium]
MQFTYTEAHDGRSRFIVQPDDELIVFELERLAVQFAVQVQCGAAGVIQILGAQAHCDEKNEQGQKLFHAKFGLISFSPDFEEEATA